MTKVLISGTGFAGRGHAEAFRAAGAEIVGIVGRTPKVVEEVAREMGIPHAGTDWQAALETCRPDIVSIATPGGAHYEPIKQAIAFGAHVFCDKPMTADGDTAAELHALAQEKGVKTAYAASFRYAPGVLHAKALVEQARSARPRRSNASRISTSSARSPLAGRIAGPMAAAGSTTTSPTRCRS
ncbi:Gfo/Idh/MocA family protein [Limimaricola cinnabarinus]|uniref:Oxidoreductase, N-terminal:oxidoreductase, C-terminal n=1 Tax=Limimaricola cinnabarinus LL-001 TaxID=1337093 RepID=U3AFL5_9RHOB|nr:Gfo/Idh/MocA family oxidoreductase [Limimaricola cinnabarinus]GAD56464.1 oxidoreductase, N-terminal:oxidoreductase, C-terminal [Limimaricola cinnabarinus LL-001]